MKSAILGRRPLSALACLVAVGATLSALEPAAQAQSLRFNTTQPGNVVAVGNTLGLSKQTGLNGPGTADAIGTFITLDATSSDTVPPNTLNPWGPGTTNDWTANGSTAALALPVEAEVLYAELVWGGSYAYGTENVLASLDTPVTLSFGADSIPVTPASGTAITIDDFGTFAIKYYMRSADVTSFVQAHKSGTYSTEGVPGTQDSLVNATNAAGWTLVIAYRYDNEPIRNMSVFVGGLFVDEFTSVDYEIDGFCAPPAGVIEGSIAISTIEGDSNRVGDQLAIGDSPGDLTFVTLSGPNNPVDNFFCSQINDQDGNLDTLGTFGNLNHIPGSNASGARQGWDIAHIALTSTAGHLAPSQTAAVLRTQTNDDSYMPVLAGMSIGVNAPKFLYDQSTTVVDKTSVTLGDSFELTVKLVNEGSAPANGVEFTLPLASGLELTNFTTNSVAGDINGDAVTQAMLTTGVPMGDLAPGASRTVALDIEVAGAQTADILLKPVWKYAYKVCVNDAATDEVFKADAAEINYEGAMGTGGGGGGSGNGGGAGTGGSSGDGGSGTTATPQGGGFFTCAASPAPQGSDPWTAFAGLAALGVLIGWRRRERAR